MIIRTNKDNNPFVMLDKTALNDSNLSWKAKGVHAFMMSKPDDWKFYMENIEKSSKDGRESLRSAFKELQEQGYLTRRPHQDSQGRLDGWETIVHEQPIERKQVHRKTGFPSDGETDRRENRQTGEPTDGKPAATNNNLTNNDLTKNNNTKNELKSNEQDKLARAFSEVWELYPNKKGKAVAFREYKKALKAGVQHETIINGVQAYARTCGTDIQFIAHGSTWFNQKRWDDDYSAKGGSSHGSTPQNSRPVSNDRSGLDW